VTSAVSERRSSRIILATHGGRTAHGATRVASLLARRLGAELDTVGVLPRSLPMDSGFGLAFPPSIEAEEELASQTAREIVRQMTQCGVPECHPTVRIGQPAIAIADAARAVNAVLIVLGLGPHHAIDRALGGETALQLVQVASTPVFAVPAAANALPRRAVVATDFTPTSLAVAQTAASLVADDAVVELVHVRGSGRHEPSVPDAERRLRDLATSIELTGPLKIEASVFSGPPAPTILEVARSRGADMIALGSHGYGLWKQLTIGSVASKIIRLTEVAVLVQPIGSIGAPSVTAANALGEA
jgi:nucleotide-binding universal stress UspA family protein